MKIEISFFLLLSFSSSPASKFLQQAAERTASPGFSIRRPSTGSTYLSHCAHMAPIDTLPTGPATRNASAEKLAARQIELASQRSKNIGDLQNDVRKQIDYVAGTDSPTQAEVMMELKTITLEERLEVKNLMEQRVKELADASKGYEDVTLTDDLPNGVLGETQLENPDAAVVRRDLAHDPKELKQTAMHESDEEVGHASQVAPKVQNEEAALIVDGEEVSATAVVEGDVEVGVQEKMGKTSRREGQPQDVYAEGQDAAEKVQGQVGKDIWKKALKETGNYGDIQKEIWTEQLKTSNDIQTVIRIADEAERTGYQKEAREAVMGMAV